MARKDRKSRFWGWLRLSDIEVGAHLPKLYGGVLEMQVLVERESALLEEADAQIRQLSEDQFIAKCSSNMLTEYERMFGIAYSTSESDGFRRARLMNRMATKPPYTLAFLRQRLDEIIGRGRYTVQMDYDSYTLYIESAAENQQWAHETAVTIGKLKPCNIVYVSRPLISANLLAAEEISYAQREYNYHLGTTWRLGMKPFVSRNNKGVVKPMQNKSLQPEILSGIARALKSDVAAARINGAIMIPAQQLQISAQNDKLVITYTVTRSVGLTEVTRAELLNADGSVLTRAEIYIPLPEDIEMKHTIKFAEGA